MSLELVVDRTQVDYEEWLGLSRTPWESMSAEQKATWSMPMRGAYNYTDLNRVGNAMSYLSGLIQSYGYSVSVYPKTDWENGDMPTPTQMEAYLDGVQAVKTAFYGATPLPDDMDDMTIEIANNIEKLLIEIEEYINRMVAGFRKCGTFKSGQGVILP